MTPIVTITLLANLAALLTPSGASLNGRQENEEAAMCANWLITTTYGEFCCPGVLQSHDGDNGVAEWCCVGNNFPNATYCGDHEETYNPQTASCSASFKISTEGYTSSVLSAASKYTVTKAVNPTPVTGDGTTSTSCHTITAGIATSTEGATSKSSGLAQPAITAATFVRPMIAVGGLLLAL